MTNTKDDNTKPEAQKSWLHIETMRRFNDPLSDMGFKAGAHALAAELKRRIDGKFSAPAGAKFLFKEMLKELLGPSGEGGMMADKTDDELYHLVEHVTELGDTRTIGLFVKGHVDFEQAKRVMASYAKAELDFDDDDLENTFGPPKHERWRKVPCTDECGCGGGFRYLAGMGRGSFAVTVIDLDGWAR